MKFHHVGKFDGDETKLPQREHPEGSVPFREPEMKQLAIIANVGAAVVTVMCAALYFDRAISYFAFAGGDPLDYVLEIYLGLLGSLLVLLPHELLHAICFREDVYLYTYLKKGMLFVVGPEDMSRRRFVFMSLLPNLVFGLLPYTIFMAYPKLLGLGFFGAMCLGEGFGDYLNVFNALTQVPKNGIVYLSGIHSYWYLPKE